MSAINTRPDFMRHPYWDEVLRFPQQDTNPYLARVTKADKKLQNDFLRLVAEGFYPISYTSPLAFQRVAELSEVPAVKETAQYIYEVELGMHPFIKGNKYQDVLHCLQYKATLASLLDDGRIDLPHPGAYSLIHELDLRNAPMVKALAVCDEIEHQAPEIIVCFQDFVAQWQYLTNRSSRLIDRTYLDEHGLTEGTDEEDQHVEMVERMKAPYADLIQSVEYTSACAEYNMLCLKHIDYIYTQLQVLIAHLPESSLQMA